MRLLILVALPLLWIPSLTLAQTFPGGSVPPDRTYSHRYSGQDHTTSITAIQLAPNFTVYQGSDGSSTTVIQTTPTMQSYFSHDKYGRELT